MTNHDCNLHFYDAINSHGPFWHFCTPGTSQQILFTNQEEYQVGMCLVALCAHMFPQTRIVTFELMSNHVHFILWGQESNCIHFFDTLKQLFKDYFKRNRPEISLDSFNASPIAIPDLDAIKTQIVYTNRNNYVVDPSQTPFSYPYGANGFYFSPVAKSFHDCLFSDLTVRQKRRMFHRHDVRLPDDYKVIDNYISPESFCWISSGEKLFRDARQYFNKLAKGVESYKEIAELLGDTVFYTDDELISVIYGICAKQHNGQKPTLLGRKEKMDLARILHFDYNADNAKISRLINLPKGVIQELFPFGK